MLTISPATSSGTLPLVLTTGARGLVGSKLLEDLKSRFRFRNLDITDPQRPVDITNVDQVKQACAAEPAVALVHFAAFTDVTKAWEERGQKDGVVYRVNVGGTKNVAQAAREAGLQLVHISTAYVFDGEKEGLYTEEDAPHPIEWYGETKWLAEQEVMNEGKNWTILRIDQPFRSDVFAKKDIVRRIVAGLEAGTLYPQFTDHTFGPTFIDDFVQVIGEVVDNKITGLFHASSGEKWSDYDFARAVAEAFHFDPSVVKEGSLATYLKTLNRPYQKNTAMSVEKLRAELQRTGSSFVQRSIKEALTSCSQ